MDFDLALQRHSDSAETGTGRVGDKIGSYFHISISPVIITTFKQFIELRKFGISIFYRPHMVQSKNFDFSFQFVDDLLRFLQFAVPLLQLLFGDMFSNILLKFADLSCCLLSV